MFKRYLTKVASVLIVAFALSGCMAELRGPTSIGSTTATLEAVGRSDCGGHGDVYFEYGVSAAIVASGGGIRTTKNHFDETAFACEENPPMYRYPAEINGLTPGTTYFYRLCGNEDGEPAQCTNVSQFTTREDSPTASRPQIAGDRFVKDGRDWKPWGFNMNHRTWREHLKHPTEASRAKLRAEFERASNLGANSMRVYLELFDFVKLDDAGKLRLKIVAAREYQYLMQYAQEFNIYLDVSGNLVWSPADAPAWYDTKTTQQRWDVQKYFWSRISSLSSTSPMILSYELTSEPALSNDPAASYYSGKLGDYMFIQRIAIGVQQGQENAVARDWVTQLSGSIRAKDPNAVITIGLLPFDNGPFGPSNVGDLLDVIAVHHYPKTGGVDRQLEILDAWIATGKPVFVGETALFGGGEADFRQLLDGIAARDVGVTSVYEAVHPEDMPAPDMTEAIRREGARIFLEERQELLR